MATNVFEMYAKLGFDSSSFSSGLSAASSAFSGFSSLIQSGFSMLSQSAGAFINDSIQTGMQFDSAMSQVAATMGVTVDEVQELRDFAKEMGSTTAFSASQAAEALNYMALAGYDAQKSMEMLPTVLNLAASGGMQLGRASDMVTDAQSALGLSMEETTQLADKMAAAASKSNTTVSMLGDAILTIGATGREIRGGTTELATILGVLADNGIKAGEGGTHLRNMLLSLQNPTDDGREALENMGIAVYDSEGKMRSLIDIFGDMRVAMQGMDDAAKNTIKNDLFNKTDLASINALLGTSQERFIELGNAIDSSVGSAEKMAGTQLDNLQGDITKFQSALEGIKLSVSEVFTPFKRGMTQFGTDLMGRISTALAIGDVKKTTKALLNIAKWTFKDIQEVIPEIVNTVYEEFLQPVGEVIISRLPDWIHNASENIVRILNGATELLGGIDLEKIGSYIAGLMNEIDWKKIIVAISGFLAAAVKQVPDFLKGLIENIDFENGAALLSALFVPKIISQLAASIVASEAFGSVTTALSTQLSLSAGIAAGNASLTFMSAFVAGFVGWQVGTAIREAIGGEKIDEFLEPFLDNWYAGLRDLIQILDEVKAKFDEVKDTVKEFFNLLFSDENDDSDISVFDKESRNSMWKVIKRAFAFKEPDSNAIGNYVDTPRLSWVAEKEPEYIIPESKMKEVYPRNGGNTYNFTVNINGSGMTTEEQARELADLSIAQIRAIGGTGF